jgi:hypothetical protein
MKSPQMIKQILTEKAGTLVKKKSEDGSNSSKKSTNQ